jgi:hypothetical protein
VVTDVDSSHVCLLLSARTLVVCLKVTIRPGRFLISRFGNSVIGGQSDQLLNALIVFVPELDRKRQVELVS